VPDQEPNPFSLNDRNGEVSFSPPANASEVQPGQHQSVLPPVSVSDTQTVNDPPTLTVSQVKEKWEYVKRRVKTKKDGAIVAALLNDYTVVLIEGSSTQPVVVIKALADFHFKAIQKSEERQKLIEWALKIELGQECRVRLLSPTQSVPLPSITPPSLPRNPENGNGSVPPPPSSSPRNSGGGSATLTMPQVASTLMAPSLERPLSVQPPVSSRSDELLLSATQGPTASVFSSPPPGSVSPLARTESVRENSKATSSSPDGKTRSGETRQAQIEKKAKADPVVQETLRVFKAQVKEIHLK